MKLAAYGLVALIAAQTPRVIPLRDAVVFGRFDSNVEAIKDPAAAARWVEVQRRAERAMSRLRPPPDHSGLISMVWGKRQHYERLFNATAAVRGTSRDDELWLAEEVADFVEGMRPCYEWEGFSSCPFREAEFAEFWLRFDMEKSATKAADARRRATGYLTQAAAGKDPLFKLAASQMLADPKCFVSPY